MRELRENSQAEASEIFIEYETGDMIEQRGHNHKRDGIAER